MSIYCCGQIFNDIWHYNLHVKCSLIHPNNEDLNKLRVRWENQVPHPGSNQTQEQVNEMIENNIKMSKLMNRKKNE